MRVSVIADLNIDCRQSEDTYETLEEWLSVSREKHCDLCLHVGKFFNQALPTNSALAKTIGILQQSETHKPSGTVKAITNMLNDEEKESIAFVAHKSKEKGHGLPLILAESSRTDRENVDSYRTGVGVLVSAKSVSLLRSRAGADWAKVHVEPLILVKGKVVIALYTLEHMPQEHLEDLILRKKLTFGAVSSEYTHSKTLYTILIIHQRKWSQDDFIRKDSHITISCKKESRAAEDLNNIIPIHFDLIIWGNTRGTANSLETSKLHGSTTFCYHPGSVTATRLTQAYSGPSNFTILEFNIKPPMVYDFFRLKSVRKLVVDSIDVEQSYDFEYVPTTQLDEPFEEICMKQVREKIYEMIATASLDDVNDKKPLIRLTVHARRVKPFAIYSIRDELDGIVANYKDSITIAVRATSRHMPDLGSPRTFGKNLSSKKPLESTKISAELEIADYLRRHFSRPYARKPRLLDANDLLNRLESSQRRGTTDEDLTSFLDDHSYHVQREVLRIYRESSSESGVHILPKIESEMKDLEESYWDHLEGFLHAQIGFSGAIGLQAQRMIGDANDQLDIEADGSRQELSQLSDLFRSRRFSQSKKSEVCYESQLSQAKRAKIVDVKDEEAFKDDFNQISWEYQPDEIWSNYDCTAHKSKAQFMLSEDEVESEEDYDRLEFRKQPKRARPQNNPNPLITPKRY